MWYILIIVKDYARILKTKTKLPQVRELKTWGFFLFHFLNISTQKTSSLEPAYGIFRFKDDKIPVFLFFVASALYLRLDIFSRASSRQSIPQNQENKAQNHQET